MIEQRLNKINNVLFINGEFVSSDSPKIAINNPARGDVIGHTPSASIPELENAVTAARNAFPQWAALPASARAKFLHRLGDAISKDASVMAQIMTLEQGKPINEAKGEILKLAEACHFYAEEATRVHGEIIPNDQNGFESLVVREPIGVVGAITPWNYPAELVGWKLCASLASGCTIIIKPAEITPFTALMIAEKVQEVGIPAGVVNVLTGKGSVIGQGLVEHHEVDKIAFTGSTQVGLQIQNTCPSIKRLTLELGGNCPLIVTEKADIDSAVTGAVRRSFRNMGQICIAINRIYVHQSVYGLFLEKLVAATESLVIDDGTLNPAADLGSMASKEPLEKTKEHLKDAINKGAKLLHGGKAPNNAALKNGFFFEPTIVGHCTHEMKVMTEETFGPLVGVAPYTELDEAIKFANDTKYGLAAYVYSTDLKEIKKLSSQLDYGNVAVNNVDAGIMNAPYGGRKQSGIGYEHGRAGLLEYFNFKHVRLRYN